MNKIKSFRYMGVLVTVFACDSVFHYCLEFNRNDAVFSSDHPAYVDAVEDACFSVLNLTRTF